MKRGSEPAARRSFGLLLRQFRTAAGFSQEELAERANVSIAAVGALERGTRRAPQRQTLALLLEALGLAGAEQAELLDAASRSRARTRDLPSAGVAAPAHAARETNVPVWLTPFVARRAEIDELLEMIRDHRLVTIVGPGGIGKTRLVCEVLGRLTTSFDRIVFADLAPLIDGDMLAPYLAGILQAELQDSVPLDAVISALEDDRVLLVMDNCERLLEPIAALSTALLKQRPHLHIVATSRERLSVSGERIYRLQPLELPRRDSMALVDAVSAAAVQLFVNRAQAVEPRFALREHDLADVVDICNRLDGIPLAIELAAARLPTLGMNQLRRQLDRQFDAAGGYRDAPVRHQTMYATIAWSFDLLDARERTVIDRAGIFAGGFTLDAAETVCTDETLDPAAMLNALSRLVEKSLLLVNHDGGTLRYRMLEPVRLYSLERLQHAGALQQVARRHAGWIADRARAANEETMRSLTHRSISTQMVAELDNIRAALERLIDSAEPGDIVLAARIAGGLRTVWVRFFLYEEGARWARAIFTRLDTEAEPELAALVMRLLIQCVPQPPERSLIENAVRIFARVSDYYALSNFYINAMQSGADAGELDLAETCRREAERLFESDHALKGVFFARFHSASAYFKAIQGHFDLARMLDEQAAAILEREGAPEDHARRGEIRGLIEAFAGNYSDAIVLERDALATIAKAGPGLAIVSEDCYANLATYSFLNGDIDDALLELHSALAGRPTYFVSFLAVVHIASALATRRDAFEAGARLKGFFDHHISSKKGRFRTPLETRLDESIEAAFDIRDRRAEREQWMALGARMSAAEARTFALTVR